MANAKKWVFIINPIAGNGFAGEYVAEVKNVLEKNNLSADIVFTQRKGHATQIAQDYYQKGYQYFITVGGDGTFSETIQPLVGKNDVIFGSIPAGTGNDFINILGFSERFTAQDWSAFLKAETIKMDVGQCNNQYFINGMGLGFDAQVAAENYQPENSRKVKKGSKSKYWWHIVKTLLLYREQEMAVLRNNETIRTKTFLNTIANGRRLAGGFYLTPDAIANDGFLNICMIRELNFRGRVKVFGKVIKQTHLEDPVVNYFQTNQISFQFDKEVPAHLDGELYFNTKFDVTIVPSALNIIYNPMGEHCFKM